MTFNKVRLKSKASESIYNGFFEGNENFGFVKAISGKFESDIFIPRKETKGAKTGEEVDFIITRPGSEGKKPEGKIIFVHPAKSYEGKFESLGDFGFIKPSDQKFKTDFYVSGKNLNGALNGDVVKFEPSLRFSGKKLEAKITGIISKASKEESKKTEFKGETIIGILNVTKTGHNFVDVAETSKGYYVFERNKGKALPGDKVEASVKTFKGRDEAEVIRVIERSKKPIVGEYSDRDTFGFVKLDNEYGVDIFVTKSHSRNAKEGDKVGVVITEWTGRDKNPRGKVVKVLGHIEDNSIDIESLIFGSGIKTEFDKRLLHSVENLPENPEKEDFEGRKDLRKDFIVTIDGADAKDLDDAISIEKLDDGYKLSVHIADVSNYVEEGSFLDIEALERGTSVYLVDRVIPMLPQKLSNGLCSLNPHVPRLSLTCEMILNSDGTFKDYKVYESVIEVNHRLTYDFVRDVIEGKVEDKDGFEYLEDNGYSISGNSKDLEELTEKLNLMEELRKVLMTYKKSIGVLEFDFPESKILLDENKKAVEIKQYERHFAHRIIEEFMILANEAISKQFSDIPFLYRIHPKPLDDSLEKLRGILSVFGYTLPTGDITPAKMSKLISEISGDPKENILNKMILRSLTKALYSDKNEGHFGLALGYYSHFTSPIRRYPDLQIHRIIKEKISGKYTKERETHYSKLLGSIGEDTSERELSAERLEYAVIDMKKCEYMEDKVGQTFTGKVSSIISKGFWVELENTIEGFVSVSTLSEFYDFDDKTISLVGKSGDKINIGDSATVKLLSVDKSNKRIDFDLIK